MTEQAAAEVRRIMEESRQAKLDRDVNASLENIADGGGTVEEHAELLAYDHGLTLEVAQQILLKAIAEDPFFQGGE